MEILQLPEIDSAQNCAPKFKPKPPFLSVPSGPTNESSLVSRRKKDLLLVKRENERIRKSVEARRMAELERKEVKKAEIYAINTFLKDVFEQRFEGYSTRRRLEALVI